MTLLAPLGLLGLLGVVALIIIYIIRPNFQQRFISSTYVWKLSLKYRKKRIPTSKLRNWLLILCQILILTICAAILTKPVQVIQAIVDETEVIAIIDSSASMRTSLDGETRFKRAVTKAEKLADDVLDQSGIVSVILAGQEADFLVQRATIAERGLVDECFLPLEEEDACSYGESDVEGAIILCEEVLRENPSAKIYLYTDESYSAVPEGIEVVNVSYEDEWNAAILDASAELDNNYYTFVVDVAYYCDPDHDSSDKSSFTVSLNIANANPNANGVGSTVKIDHLVTCERNTPKKLVFITSSNYDEIQDTVENTDDDSTVYIELAEAQEIYSYQAVYVLLSTQKDSYPGDNSFNLFNGQKEIIRLQYASSLANPFVRAILFTWQAKFADLWDIRITEVKNGVEPATEGFDLYFFEGLVPEILPSDGVLVLLNPTYAPKGLGIRIEQVKDLPEDLSLTAEGTHPILENVNPDNMTVRRYAVVSEDGTGEGEYQAIVSCDSSPVVMVKNEPESKIFLMNFSLHYSNLPILADFPIMMSNMFRYFFPSTVEKYAFDVYETVKMNARGEKLAVSHGSESIGDPFESFPASMQLNKPGNYELSQTVGMGYRKKQQIEYIFVKIPASESNIWLADQTLENPYKVEEEIEYYKDWLLYLAAGLVALLFLEWWLHNRENV